MLEMLIVLCGFQLLGEVIIRILNLSIPGSVVGMLLLFITLLIRRGVPHFMAENTPKLMGVLVLLFIPTGVGIIQYFDLLSDYFWRLSLIVFVAVIGTQLFSAWILKFLLIRNRARKLNKIVTKKG